jgi:hypothetical protein
MFQKCAKKSHVQEDQPMGAIASIDVGSIFSGIGSLAKDIREAVKGKEMTPELQVQLQQKAMDLELATTNAQMEMITAEAKSSDPWTSRARPTFMYVFYLILLTCGIFAPAIGVFFPQTMTVFFTNMGLGFKAIPSDLYALFGAGYLGYTGFRTFEKVKGVTS